MPDWYLFPTITLPTQDTGMTPSLPVFRSETNCPIPYEWLIGAVLAGLLLGYLIRGGK